MMIRRIMLCFVPLMIVPAILADSWSPITAVNAPTARAAHSVVFTRIDGTDQMIVWGGQDSPMTPFANTGARWKRSTNVWAATTTTNAPSGRDGHPAVWTGHEMLIWGGDDGLNFLNTGGRYDPVTDTWRPTSLTGAPAGRFGHSFIWTGDRLIVWVARPDLAATLTRVRSTTPSRIAGRRQRQSTLRLPETATPQSG